MVFETQEIVRPVQRVDEVLELKMYRDWYNGAANLTAAKVRLSRIRLYQNQFAILDQDIDNYRISRTWLTNRHGNEEGYLLLDYIELLGTYLFQRNFYTELVDWCEDGLRVCLRLQRNPAPLLFLKGKTLNALGHWQEALHCYHVAIEKSSETDRQIHAHAILALGQLQFNQGEYAVALKTLDHAEKLLNEARLLCGKAKTLYEEIQDRRGISDVYEQLGCIELAEGHIAEAISSLKQSLAIRKEIHNQQGFASCLSRLVFAYCKLLQYTIFAWLHTW